MSTYYEVSKCKKISFINDMKLAKGCNKIYFKDFDIVRQQTSHFDLIIDASSELFKDIKIVFNENKKGLPSTSEKTQDVKSDIMLGGGKNLDAFTTNSFVVIPGKKSCNVRELHVNQNHEILDTIARNGVLLIPEVQKELSIKQLFDILSTKNSFTITVYHSGLKIPEISGTYPSEYTRPKYEIGFGEVAAIFYRYICIYFFGYCSVYNEDEVEHKYDI